MTLSFLNENWCLFSNDNFSSKIVEVVKLLILVIIWTFTSRVQRLDLQSLNSWRSRGWTNSGLTVSNHQNSSAMNTITLCCKRSKNTHLKNVIRMIEYSV